MSLKMNVSNNYRSIYTNFRRPFCEIPLKMKTNGFRKQPVSNVYRSLYTIDVYTVSEESKLDR